MERELWPVLYRLIHDVANAFSQKAVTYQPGTIVLVLVWAALHDRPRQWACDPRHWSTTHLRPVQLPSPSTLSRRAKSLAVGLLLRALEDHLRQSQDPGLLAFLDGKPLAIGGCSKDRAAKRGRAAGGMAYGYKLHTLWANRPVPEAWEVTPLNASESVVAQQLVQRAPGTGYLLADGNYDSSPLFDEAAAQGYQLLVPINHPNAGQGHHYQSPYRLRCIERMRGVFGKSLYQQRSSIERSYGNATTFASGLGPLPAWVRGWHRVHVWVAVKLLINAARILLKQRLTA